MKLAAKEKDAITGVETTGHEWDGIKELNNPLPKWWLYVLYATIIWSVAYWIAMPAWPTITGYTKGVLGHSQRANVVADIAAGSNTALYDLTGDGVVDQADLTDWLAQAGAANLTSGNPYLVGDANLDGVVDGQDFLTWNGSKFTATAAWCSGDFNADGLVDGQDFLLWNGNKFTGADGGAAAVPEPNVCLVLLGAVLLCIRKSR